MEKMTAKITALFQQRVAEMIDLLSKTGTIVPKKRFQVTAAWDEYDEYAVEEVELDYSLPEPRLIFVLVAPYFGGPIERVEAISLDVWDFAAITDYILEKNA